MSFKRGSTVVALHVNVPFLHSVAFIEHGFTVTRVVKTVLTFNVQLIIAVADRRHFLACLSEGKSTRKLCEVATESPLAWYKYVNWVWWLTMPQMCVLPVAQLCCGGVTLTSLGKLAENAQCITLLLQVQNSPSNTYIHTYTHTYIHTHVRTHARTHARTHTHTHTYVRTHMYLKVRRSAPNVAPSVYQSRSLPIERNGYLRPVDWTLLLAQHILVSTG